LGITTGIGLTAISFTFKWIFFGYNAKWRKLITINSFELDSCYYVFDGAGVKLWLSLSWKNACESLAMCAHLSHSCLVRHLQKCKEKRTLRNIFIAWLGFHAYFTCDTLQESCMFYFIEREMLKILIVHNKCTMSACIILLIEN